jgi:hypothetical protein
VQQSKGKGKCNGNCNCKCNGNYKGKCKGNRKGKCNGNCKGSGQECPLYTAGLVL